jgi:hypothetical protein
MVGHYICGVTSYRLDQRHVRRAVGQVAYDLLARNSRVESTRKDHCHVWCRNPPAAR